MLSARGNTKLSIEEKMRANEETQKLLNDQINALKQKAPKILEEKKDTPVNY